MSSHRSTSEQFHFPDSAYLKEHVGDCLRLGLAEICEKKPADPITFLAQYLYKYEENMAALEKRTREKIQLEVERHEHELELQRQEKLAEELREREREAEERRQKELEEQERLLAEERDREEERRKMEEMEEQEKARMAELEKMPLESKLPPVMEGEEAEGGETVAAEEQPDIEEKQPEGDIADNAETDAAPEDA